MSTNNLVYSPPFIADQVAHRTEITKWMFRKSPQLISIKDFAAEGTTDFTSAQNAAIAALSSLGSGILSYPPDSYIVNSKTRNGGLTYRASNFPSLVEQQRTAFQVLDHVANTEPAVGFGAVMVSGSLLPNTLANFVANANQDMVGVSSWTLRGGTGNNFTEAANFGCWFENNLAATWAVEIDVNNEGATKAEGDSTAGIGININTGSTYSPDTGIFIGRSTGAGSGPGYKRGITIAGARNAGIRIEAMASATYPGMNPAAPGTIQAIQLLRSDDTQFRWFINQDGGMSWGTGNAVQDVTLVRSGASTLQVGGNLAVTGSLQDSAVWATSTPTPTAFAGTFTTVSASIRWNQIGKRVFFSGSVIITTNGTAAGYVILPLPVTASNVMQQIVCGRANAVSGKMLQGQIVSTVVNIYNYDNTYPGANGETLLISGSYEAA